MKKQQYLNGMSNLLDQTRRSLLESNRRVHLEVDKGDTHQYIDYAVQMENLFDSDRYIPIANRHVHIRITAQRVGMAFLRNEFFAAGKPIDLYKEKRVPTYRLVVNDDLTNIETTYQITRHAVYDDDVKKYDLYYHFEPQDISKRFRGGFGPNELGAGTALFLFEDRPGRIRGDLVRSDNGKKNNAFIQIHVGGRYINENNGEMIATSSGCFTLNGPDAGDEGRDRFNNDVASRHDRINILGEARIFITFEKLRR